MTISERQQFSVTLSLAWVVWIRAEKSDLDLKRPKVSDWERVGSHKTLEDCEKALALQADTFEFYLKRRDPETKRHGKVFVSHDDEFIYAHEFSCLSDTVDPRGPKGK
jgi:hypothetical protein